MKSKKIVAVLLMAIMVFGGRGIRASAAEEVLAFNVQMVYGLPRSSEQLDSYSIGLTNKGNGKLTMTYTVFGTHEMACIGAQKIVVEEELAPDEWGTYKTYSSLYNYNDISRAGSIEVSVIAGTKYRAVLTAYGRDSSGSDTGTVTSYEIVAK